MCNADDLTACLLESFVGESFLEVSFFTVCESIVLTVMEGCHQVELFNTNKKLMVSFCNVRVFSFLQLEGKFQAGQGKGRFGARRGRRIVRFHGVCHSDIIRIIMVDAMHVTATSTATGNSTMVSSMLTYLRLLYQMTGFCNSKLPKFSPEELLSLTFLHDTPDGQCVHAQVIRQINDFDLDQQNNTPSLWLLVVGCWLLVVAVVCILGHLC